MDGNGKPAGNKQFPAFLPVLTQSSTVSALLEGAIATVHADGLAVNERSSVGADVQHGVGHILRQRHAADGVHLDLHLLQ
jgi:hypothetical protein